MKVFGKRRIAKLLVIGLLAALAFTPVVGPAPTVVLGDPECGTERWSVKTGTDPDAKYVDLNNIVPMRVPILSSWPMPDYLPPNNRIAPYEYTVCFFYAHVTQYKKETDSDYHVVLTDPHGHTIIGEIPLPSCVGTSSPFRNYIINARAEFDAMFNVTTYFQYTDTPVLVTGVCFFDFDHGQTGHAPNFIELHPILDIIFL
jgi:hypothetical protein